MRVKELHPLCCISLESSCNTPRIGDQSPDATLSRTRSLPVRLAVVSSGSEANVDRSASGSDATVAGVIHKWTNYSKGWRSRWFLLRNGVLSYAKIRRSESLNLLTPSDDVKLIGEISTNRLSRMDSGSARRKHQKNVGIVHLKVIVLKTVRFQ